MDAFGSRRKRSRSPPKSHRINSIRAKSLRVLTRKVPLGRIQLSTCAGPASFMAWKFIAPAFFSWLMAFSALTHAVFWASTAPTIISQGVSAGHQCCGPHAAWRTSKTACRGGLDPFDIWQLFSDSDLDSGNHQGVPAFRSFDHRGSSVHHGTLRRKPSARQKPDAEYPTDCNSAFTIEDVQSYTPPVDLLTGKDM